MITIRPGPVTVAAGTLRLTGLNVYSGDTLVQGGTLDVDETLRAAGVHPDLELTAPELETIAERVRWHYVRHGYPAAKVEADTIETELALHDVLVIRIAAGDPRRVGRRTFFVSPDPEAPGLKAALASYRFDVGDRFDQDDFAAADRDLEKELRRRGWHQATVRHSARTLGPSLGWLQVNVAAGPLMQDLRRAGLPISAPAARKLHRSVFKVHGRPGRHPLEKEAQALYRKLVAAFRSEDSF